MTTTEVSRWLMALADDEDAREGDATEGGNSLRAAAVALLDLPLITRILGEAPRPEAETDDPDVAVGILRVADERCRVATQRIVEAIGAEGPLSLEDAVTRVLAALENMATLVAARTTPPTQERGEVSEGLRGRCGEVVLGIGPCKRIAGHSGHHTAVLGPREREADAAAALPREMPGDFWKWAHRAMADAWQLGYDAAAGDGIEPTEAKPALESDLAFLLHPDQLGPPPPDMDLLREVSVAVRDACRGGDGATNVAGKLNLDSIITRCLEARKR